MTEFDFDGYKQARLRQEEQEKFEQLTIKVDEMSKQLAALTAAIEKLAKKTKAE